MTIDYLLIGHLTDDVTPHGLVPGGTVLYAAITAQRLGRRVGIVTRSPYGAVLEAVVHGVALHVLPSAVATTFENRYQGDARTQWVRHVAAPITLDEVPLAWRDASIVHLAPVAQEIAPDLMPAFPSGRLCMTPQGLLRAWDDEGRVRYAPLHDAVAQLRTVDILVLSAEDVSGNRTALDALLDAVPLGVETRAAEGAVVVQRGERVAVAAYPTDVADATGAGDVFAASYFVAIDEGYDPIVAAQRAALAASLAIARLGTSGIPTREQLERQLAITN